jgi:hypothetical protein
MVDKEVGEERPETTNSLFDMECPVCLATTAHGGAHDSGCDLNVLMKRFDSTNIWGIHYVLGAGLMTACFNVKGTKRPGAIYRYRNAGLDEYLNVVDSPSIGRAFYAFRVAWEARGGKAELARRAA